MSNSITDAANLEHVTVVALARVIVKQDTVACSPIRTSRTALSPICVGIAHERGSLTSAIFSFQVSADGERFFDVEVPGVGYELTLRESASRVVTMPNGVLSWEWFRVTVRGCGTPTSSSCEVIYAWTRQRRAGFGECEEEA